KRVAVIQELCVGGAEILPQHSITMASNVIDRTYYPRDRQLQQQQQMRQQHQAGFERFRHHFGRTRRLQLFELAVVLRPYQYRNVRPQFSNRSQDSQCHFWLRERDDDAAGMGDTDVFQNLFLSGITIDDRISGLSADADAVGVEIQSDVFEAGLLEYPRDVLSDAPEATDHDV